MKLLISDPSYLNNLDIFDKYRSGLYYATSKLLLSVILPTYILQV